VAIPTPTMIDVTASAKHSMKSPAIDPFDIGVSTTRWKQPRVNF
jgi:hypothetical protein